MDKKAELEVDDQKKLAREIQISRWVALATVGAVIGVYIYGHSTGFELSSDTAHWGQFGDYVGGLLNPLIAYGAFYWLTRSVALQKKELEDTRREFAAGVEAQIEMTSYQRATVQLHALTELLRSVEHKIGIIEDTLSRLGAAGVHFKYRGKIYSVNQKDDLESELLRALADCEETAKGYREAIQNSHTLKSAVIGCAGLTE